MAFAGGIDMEHSGKMGHVTVALRKSNFLYKIYFSIDVLFFQEWTTCL